MSLAIAVEEVGHGGRRVSLRGRLDTETAPLLDERLRPLVDSPAVTALLFDLEGLEYLSSAGIRTLVRARKALQGRGGGVVLARVQPRVQAVLDIVKALPSVDVFADDASLDAYLERMQRRPAPGPGS
jgi:anti-anti-sigma factor